MLVTSLSSYRTRKYVPLRCLITDSGAINYIRDVFVINLYHTVAGALIRYILKVILLPFTVAGLLKQEREKLYTRRGERKKKNDLKSFSSLQHRSYAKILRISKEESETKGGKKEEQTYFSMPSLVEL